MKLKLTSKMAIVIAEILLVTVGISTYIGINVEEKRLIKRTEQDSFQMSHTIYNQLERAMLSGRKEEVQSFLMDLGESEKVKEASVTDPAGMIIFSSKTTRLNQKIPLITSDLFNRSGSQLFTEKQARREIITVLTPISNKIQCQVCHGNAKPYLGVLYYHPSLDWITQESAENRKLIVYFAILIVLVSGIAITLMMKRLVREPIHALEVVMSEVAQGNLSRRVNIPTEDEIGRLGHHFNSMIDQLESANKKLAEVHETELLRAGKLASLGEMAAGLVHEMKNPLSGISAATQVLQEQYSTDDPRREIMQEMINQVERLNKTLNDLLSFARPRSPQLVEGDINEVIRNVLTLTRSQAAQQHIEIVENYSANMPPIPLDLEQIKQVLLNLILNAFQAMSTGGILTIETKYSIHQMVTVIVKDTGKGILQENISKVFEPFFTTRAKGTGLGLPVSRKIVEMHGGRLEVKSEINKGTEFAIHLPMKTNKE